MPATEEGCSTKPQRIHIVGGPGSGKSTLAREIAANLDAPCFDLDEVAYEGGAGSRRSRESRLEALAVIAQQPRWVTEGIYLWWTDRLFSAADLIVWLDLPWSLAVHRIVGRHVRTSLAGNNRHSGLLKLVRFLLWTRHYYFDPEMSPAPADRDAIVTRSATAHAVIPWKDRLLRRTKGSN